MLEHFYVLDRVQRLVACLVELHLILILQEVILWSKVILFDSLA
jgi:hypothetical protein